MHDNGCCCTECVMIGTAEFKVFCADCKIEYVQGSYKPTKCGACSSTWIAVKEVAK